MAVIIKVMMMTVEEEMVINMLVESGGEDSNDGSGQGN